MKKFTLVELIIVCAVVGILVSMLLPSLKKAHEKAKLAVCLSNQKQTVTAYNLYAVQNNNLAVSTIWYNDWAGTKGVHGWGSHSVSSRLLNQYLTNPKVAWCPSDKGDGYSNSDGAYGGAGHGDYRYNNHLGYAFGSTYIVDANGANAAAISEFTNGYSGRNGTTKLFLQSFESPNMKVLFHPVFFRADAGTGTRRWGYVRPGGTIYKNRQHDQKSPLYPLGFADGHAEIYNYFWKGPGTDGFDMIDPATSKGFGSGDMSVNALKWRLSNLKLY